MKIHLLIILEGIHEPPSPFYQVDRLLTSLSIGEALITTLAVTGLPTPLVHTYLSAPQSRMNPLNAGELKLLVQQSSLRNQYPQSLSHTENVSQKLKQTIPIQYHPNAKKLRRRQTLFRRLSKNTIIRQISRTLVRELIRLFSKWWKS